MLGPSDGFNQSIRLKGNELVTDAEEPVVLTSGRRYVCGDDVGMNGNKKKELERREMPTASQSFRNFL